MISRLDVLRRYGILLCLVSFGKNVKNLVIQVMKFFQDFGVKGKWVEFYRDGKKSEGEVVDVLDCF